MSCTKDDSSRMRPSTALGLGRVSGTAISICLLDMSFWDQKRMIFWSFFFWFHVFLKIQNLFMVFRMFFNRLDSKTTHLQLFETTAAPLSMTSESPSWCSPSQKLPKGPPRSLTEGFLVARPRRSFPGAQWRIWNPVVYYRYGHKH